MKKILLASLATLLLCKEFIVVAGNTFGRQLSAEQKKQYTVHAYNAVFRGDLRTLRHLIRAGVKADEIKNRPGTSGLDAAICRNHPDVVRCLLDHRASVAEEDAIGQTSITKALEDVLDGRNKSLDIAYLLLRHHPNRAELFNNRWVQRNGGKSALRMALADAVDEVEDNTERAKAVKAILQILNPVTAIVESYLSYRLAIEEAIADEPDKLIKKMPQVTIPPRRS